MKNLFFPEKIYYGNDLHCPFYVKNVLFWHSGYHVVGVTIETNVIFSFFLFLIFFMNLLFQVSVLHNALKNYRTAREGEQVQAYSNFQAQCF